MNAVIDGAIRHARMVLSALVLIFVAGTVTFLNIPKEADPDITIPVLYVQLTHEGIAPEDSERLLVRPLEQELRTLEGIKEMRGTAFEGGGNVVLEFEAGFDIERAKRDLRERVDFARSKFPADTKEPRIHEVNLSLFPVIVVALSGDVPERAMMRIARDLREKIESLPQVLKVEIGGDREEQVEVIVDPSKVESYGLSLNDVLAFAGRGNRLIAAGAIEATQGRFAIKVPGLFENLRDIMSMPLKTNGDAVVRLSDVGEIRRGVKDPKGFARVGGRPAVSLEVSKRIGRNLIDTNKDIRALVEAERPSWPSNLEVHYLQDKSDSIVTMLIDLEQHVIMAVLLVMVLVLGAVGVRSGLMVGLSIPGSFLAGILVLSLVGLTINIVVMFSLILAVGMLVDDSIIVGEYADRKLVEGMPKAEAYAHAAKRMLAPIVASTATTLAAFLPLLFWPGSVGQFMKYLPITLISTLTASLVMAVVFLPVLGSLFGKAGSDGAAARSGIAAGETGDLGEINGVTGLYVRVLGKCLDRPGSVLLATLAITVGVFWHYANNATGVEFFPNVEPEQVQINIRARGNLSIHEKDALVREVEIRVLPIRGFDAVYTRTGGDGAGVQDKAEDTIGVILLQLGDWKARPKADSLMTEMRLRTADLAGILIEVQQEEAGPPVGKPVQIQLSAIEHGLLPAAAETIRRKFEAMPGLVDIEDSRALPGIEWQISVDRGQAAKFGADVTLVGTAIRMVTNGAKFAEYRPDDSDKEIDIALRYPSAFRNLDQLGRIKVQTASGLVPIDNFVSREAKPKIGTISRTDGRRVLMVKANVRADVKPDDMVRDIRAWLPTSGIDPRVRVAFKGQDEEQAAAQDFLGKAFGLALFLIAIILLIEFNSFFSTFLVLSAVVLSTVGVLIGLIVTGQTFGIVMGGIAVISLAGVVVKNNIVLIDTYDDLKHRITDPREAILRTGAQRLRPVFLTAATVIIGLLPLSYGVNIDFLTREIIVDAPASQWWIQLATAMVYGMAFATPLTLVVTPAALMLRARWSARFALRRRMSEAS
jgi:multidrug efflux pump